MSVTSIDRRLLTVPEVMAAMALSRWKVYDLIRSGQLESIKVGRGRRIPLDAVDAYVTEQRREAA